MNNKFFILIMLLISLNCKQQSYAQQIVMNSQYMINSFVLNPAVAGTKTYAPLVLSARRQWMGIREAPVAQHLSYHTSINKYLGVGGAIFNDVAGPARRTGLLVALSTQVETSKYDRVSFGLATSMSQYMIRKQYLITEEDNDNTVLNYTSNRLIPDIAFGIKFYGDRYQVGLSGFNIIQSKVDLTDIMTTVTNKLERTFYLNGSYIIPLGKHSPLITLEPSAVLRYMSTAPLQFDINLRAIYNKRLWAGISYRFKDATALMVGFSTSKIGISYSYDISMSGLSKYNSGSHEVTLTLRHKNKRGNFPAGGQRFNTYDCPTF